MSENRMIEIGQVIESAPNMILIRIDNESVFEDNKKLLQIGKYLQIEEGNHNYVLCIIQNIKLNEKEQYVINTQPIGVLSNEAGDIFKQGGVTLPSPTEKAFIADQSTLEKVFKQNDSFSFKFGRLVQNQDVFLHLDGNKFFSKHIAVIGSTGSGKSCAVSRILQDIVGINNSKNLYKNNQRNSHILIFDIHSEYASAFSIDDTEKFNLNILDVEKLKLPYWLMNSEELESLFIESSEQNSHNQISQFKKAVILNKEKHNPSLSKITYDTPCYFDIKEVYNYIFNLNNEVINKKEGEAQLPKLLDGSLVTDKNTYFEKIYDFAASSNSKDSKANNGPFYGDFDRFISRLDTKLNDKRLEFLLKPVKDDGTDFKTEDFEIVLKQFLGYLNKSNISIIDLSGIPFEVLSITISLISRLVFDFAFHYSKLKHINNQTNDIPFMIVCEEAHNYIPRTGGSEYNASKKSIERIAKEGRKYGLSLMVVSQRPSEVSDTIFSQCNNFVALRLTNVNDQSYIKSLLPDNSNSVADVLPTLSAGECLIVGDATPIPVVVKLEMPNPEPKSASIKFHKEWNQNWKDVTFSDVIKRWKKE
jgi:DNA helicase HerA-like ATPase